jgi:hypothetical protein
MEILLTGYQDRSVIERFTALSKIAEDQGEAFYQQVLILLLDIAQDVKLPTADYKQVVYGYLSYFFRTTLDSHISEVEFWSVFNSSLELHETLGRFLKRLPVSSGIYSRSEQHLLN